MVLHRVITLQACCCSAALRRVRSAFFGATSLIACGVTSFYGDDAYAQATAFEKYSYETLKSLRDDNFVAIPVEDYKLVFPEDGTKGVDKNAPAEILTELDARALGLRLFINFSNAYQESDPGSDRYHREAAEIGNWRLAGQVELALIEMIGMELAQDTQLKCRLSAAARMYAEQGHAVASGIDRLTEDAYVEHIGLSEQDSHALANIFVGAYTFYKGRLETANTVCSGVASGSRAAVRASIEERVNDKIIARVQAESDTTIAGINERLEPFNNLIATLEGDGTQSWNPELNELERDILALSSNLKFVAEDHLAVEELVGRVTAKDFLDNVTRVLDPGSDHPLVWEVNHQSKAFEAAFFEALEVFAKIGQSKRWNIKECRELENSISFYKTKDAATRLRSLDDLNQRLWACAQEIAVQIGELGGSVAMEKYGAAIAKDLVILSDRVLEIMVGGSTLQ